jgi:hypothetical protein
MISMTCFNLRIGLCTETALIKVQSDIADALDKGEVVLLLMLDMPAAFDTIDHAIILRRLEHSCGITS